MNCTECLGLLQERLDGVTPGDPAGLDRHLAACPDCRDWYAAVGRLEAGVRLLPAVAPPDDLAARITGRVLADHRARQRRRDWMRRGAALAASLLLVFLIGRGRPTVEPLPVPSTEPRETESLRDTVADAGSAMVGLTRRTADETVVQGKLLLPVVVAQPPLGERAVPDAVEPPVRSLRAAGQGVSTGLEPITTSAHRALDLFLSEIPSLESERKQGL
jgi:predicted anti-sigma-YlaC factor YlaD